MVDPNDPAKSAGRLLRFFVFYFAEYPVDHIIAINQVE